MSRRPRSFTAKKKDERYNDHEDLLKAIYEIRTKLNPHDTIAGVHTLSFNRYEFKNIKPQRKEEDTVSDATGERSGCNLANVLQYFAVKVATRS